MMFYLVFTLGCATLFINMVSLAKYFEAPLQISLLNLGIIVRY